MIAALCHPFVKLYIAAMLCIAISPGCKRVDTLAGEMPVIFPRDHFADTITMNDGQNNAPVMGTFFLADSKTETTTRLFFDADGDRDSDLYVCNGSRLFLPEYALYDSFFINAGGGNFKRCSDVLPLCRPFETHACITAADFDADGDVDLFIGTSRTQDDYSYACSSYILQNDGNGHFKDVTATACPGLVQCGMVTDARWFDYDKDGRPDLAIAGRFMPVTIFHNTGDALEPKHLNSVPGNGEDLVKLLISDVNDDGYPDIVTSNIKLNYCIKSLCTRQVSLLLNTGRGDFTVVQLPVQLQPPVKTGEPWQVARF